MGKGFWNSQNLIIPPQEFLNTLLVVSGLDKTWVIGNNQNFAAARYDNHISYSYNKFIWQDDFLLGGGGFCSFRTGYCEGWLDKIVIGSDNEVLVERLYAGSVPIFTMEIVGGRLVTHGRNIMIAPLNDLKSFPVDEVEYAGGSYSGISAGADSNTFYFAENHEIFVRQFNAQAGLPVLIGRENSAPIGTFFTHMAIKDDYLYAVSSYGLHIIDISHPYEPFGIAFLTLGIDASSNPQTLLPQPSRTPTE